MGESEFEDHSWAAFCEATATRGPLEYFHSAMEFVGGAGARRLAIDVGSGGGADVLNLLSRGWNVVALDAEAASRKLLEERTPPAARGRLEIVTGLFHTAVLPKADLILAQFSLPFAGDDFDAAVANVLASVGPGGAFVGQFFAANDDWASDPHVASVDREWIEKAFDDFAELDVDERDHVGSYGDQGAMKRWHFFHIRARR